MSATNNPDTHTAKQVHHELFHPVFKPHNEGHVPGGPVHIVSGRVLLTVFGLLVLLTGATVGVTYFQLGEFNIWVALGIAVAKAALVMLYFMHLRWDSPFNAVIIIVAIGFVMIFIGFTIRDSQVYEHTFHAPGQGQVLNRLYEDIRHGG